MFLPISKCNSLHISDVMMCADKSASTNPLCLWSDYSGSEERSEEREENYFNFQPKKALTLPSSPLHVQSICHIRFGSRASQSALVVVGYLGAWLCLLEGASVTQHRVTFINVFPVIGTRKFLVDLVDHFHRMRKPCTQVCLRKCLLIARGGCNPFCSDEEALFRTTPKPEPDQKS